MILWYRGHFLVGFNTAPLFLTWGRNIEMKEQIALENGNGENKAKTAACMASVYNLNVQCSARSIFTVKNDEMRWKWATLVKRARKPKPFETNFWITSKSIFTPICSSHLLRCREKLFSISSLKVDFQKRKILYPIKTKICLITR